MSFKHWILLHETESIQQNSWKWWVSATVIKNYNDLKVGQKIALGQRKNDNVTWDYVTEFGNKGEIPASLVTSIVKSNTNPDGSRIWAPKPEELFGKSSTPISSTNPHILSKEKLSDEQREIDEDFEKLIASPDQNHILISALAGTGKTTTLKHLAWKYGNSSQRWLYLVFNTRNKVEAQEVSGGYRKFPPWVDIYTTNAFLGKVLGHPKNLDAMPQTDRMVNVTRDEGSKVEKSRILIDSLEFDNILINYGMKDSDIVTPEFLTKNGIYQPQHLYFSGALKGILRSIRFQFKERVLTLVGILKSFAVDPYSKDLDQEVEKIFNKYDSHKHDDGTTSSGYFDTELEDIKERVAKYSPTFRIPLTRILNDILGYNFMQKNYKKEIIDSSKWLLHKTVPHGTDLKYKKGQDSYNLGELRDFNDDLWYAAIFKDKINWPKYNIVLADEVQDFNEGQKMMLKKLHEAGAKIIAVGDRNQSAYRWRGADAHAFNNLSKMLGDLSSNKNNWKTHSLSKNYRSRPEILDFVNNVTHVKDLKSGKKFEGENPDAVTVEKYDYKDVFDNLELEKSKNKLKETAFISRTNEPLINTGLKLMEKGIPFVILGKDVSGGLLKHINTILKSGKSHNINELRDELHNHEADEISKHSGKSTKKGYLSELKDTTVALISAINQFEDIKGNARVDEFQKWLKEKFSGLDIENNEGDYSKYKEKLAKEKPVVLTTAHKSKGLEFDRVFILRNDQFPHSKAKHPEELAEEGNIKYIAYTRPKEELHIIKLNGQPGYKI